MLSMSKLRVRLRELWEDYRFEIIVVAVALLAALFGFLLGYLAARQTPTPIIIEQHTS